MFKLTYYASKDRDPKLASKGVQVLEEIKQVKYINFYYNDGSASVQYLNEAGDPVNIEIPINCIRRITI